MDSISTLAPKKSNNGHCNNLKSDRDIGEYWERQFGNMSADYGKSFTPLQIGREKSAQVFNKTNGKWNKYTAPDVTIWTAPGEHHEIKHKDPFYTDKYGSCFGLEIYRFNALLWFARETQQQVMYTIHNHALAGGRWAKENNINHWATANILSLNNRWAFKWQCNSYVNGKTERVDTYAWSTNLWVPLKTFWEEAQCNP